MSGQRMDAILPHSDDPSLTGGHPDTLTPNSSSRSPSATLRTTKRRFTAWLPTTFGRGMINDIRARAPYYASDWADAWNYRVIPAIVLIFFAK